MSTLFCTHCNREYKYDYKNKHGHTKKYCNSCNSNYRRFTIMKKCIDYKGGKCSICSYDKCIRSLVFHHRDPSTKKFGISGNYGYSWEVLQEELDKCDLICANCHGEIHDSLENKAILFNFKKERALKEYFSIVCRNCQKEFSSDVQSSIYCSSSCRYRGTRKVIERPSKEELSELIKKQSILSISRIYKVSDSTIRKWAKGYKIDINRLVGTRNLNVQ